MLTSVFLLQSHIEIIHGYATFADGPQPTVEVNGKKFTAPHILIATGGVPTVPQESQIPGEFQRPVRSGSLRAASRVPPTLVLS